MEPTAKAGRGSLKLDSVAVPRSLSPGLTHSAGPERRHPLTLSATEAKVAFLAFGKDTQKIANDLYKVVKRPVPPEQKEAAIVAGRQKLKAYDELLSSVSDTWKAEAADRFGHHLDAIREFLAKATEGTA